MKCICGGESVLKKGNIEFNTRFLGKTIVPDIEFYKCDKCGDQLLTPEESDKAVDYILNEERSRGIYRIKKENGMWVSVKRNTKGKN
jgi:YgiT-type zinc finger domain-containing protein